MKNDALKDLWDGLEKTTAPDTSDIRKKKAAALMGGVAGDGLKPAAAPSAASGALSGSALRVLRPVVWAPLAAAAAVALFVVLHQPVETDGSVEFVPKNGMNSEQTLISEAFVPKNADISEQIALPSGNRGVDVVKNTPICTRTPEKATPRDQNSAVLTTTPAEPTEESEVPGSTPQREQSHDASARKATPAPVATSDPFAEMAAEDARAAARSNRRPALLAGITGISASGSKTASNTVPGVVGPAYATSLSTIGDTSAPSEFISTLPYTENGRFNPPVTFSADIVYPLTDKLSLRSGLFYTWLHSSYTLKPNAKQKYITQNLHYLGIPLRADWSLAKAGSFDFYLSAGGSAAYLLSGAKKHPWQFSADLAAGAVWMFAPRIGLYLEPQLNYYFDDGSDIYNYYSAQPLSFSARLGIRFDL